jgi:hypothetical protein
MVLDLHLQQRVSNIKGTGWKSGGRMYCSLDGSVGNFVNGFVLV